MTKEEYRAHTKYELVKINKHLYKSVCRLIRQKIELKEQIADIKANCDLAIEGRDVRIMELEKEVEKHKWNDIFLEDCAGYDKKIAEEYSTLQERIKKLEKENADLRMKIYGGGYEMIITKKDADINLLEKELKELKEKYYKLLTVHYED